MVNVHLTKLTLSYSGQPDHASQMILPSLLMNLAGKTQLNVVLPSRTLSL